MVNRIFRGPTVTVGGVLYPCPELMEEITDAMKNEQEKPEVLSADLIEFYAGATDSDREVVNSFLVKLCGFSLPSLLRAALADEALLAALKIPPADPLPDELSADDT